MHPCSININLPGVSHDLALHIELTKGPAFAICTMLINLGFVLGDLLFDDLHAPLLRLVILAVLAGALDDFSDAATISIL